MKKKFVRMLGMLLVGGLFFTGCNPMRQEDTTMDTWSETLEEWKSLMPKDLEEHIALEVSDTYRLDAVISVSEELDSYKIPNIYLKRHVYDDVEIVLKELLEYCGISSYSEIVKRESEDILEGGEKIVYAMADFGEENRSFVQVRSVYALMNTPFFDDWGGWNAYGMLDTQSAGWVDYEKMRLPAEKEILTQEQAADIKANMENILEVEFMDEPVLYTYTLERLQEIMETEQAYTKAMGIDEAYTWNKVTEEDECAVVMLLQGYNGVPLLHNDASESATGALWKVDNYCVITVSKDGIECMELMNPYDITGEAEYVEILSFGEFIEKHMQMRGGVDTTVVSVGLYYLPIYTGEDLKFITKPIWYVQTEEMDEYGYPFRETTIYDAVTGIEIGW